MTMKTETCRNQSLSKSSPQAEFAAEEMDRNRREGRWIPRIARDENHAKDSS